MGDNSAITVYLTFFILKINSKLCVLSLKVLNIKLLSNFEITIYFIGQLCCSKSFTHLNTLNFPEMIS